MSPAWFVALGVGACGAAVLSFLHHRVARELSRLESAVSELPRSSGAPPRPSR